ncbi:MAG: metallophosphoesterase [Bacteroidota bacterium]
MRYIIFRFLVLLFISAEQWFLFLFLRNHILSKSQTWQRVVIAVTFTVMNVPTLLFILLPAAIATQNSPMPLWLKMFYVWQGASLLLVVYLIVIQLARGLFSIIDHIFLRGKTEMKAGNNSAKELAYSRSRRLFLKTAFAGAATYSFIGALDGIMLQTKCEITHRTIKLKNLPSSFEGTTVALISDIHSGMFMPKSEMVMYAKLLQSLNADLILMPGDFVTFRKDEVHPFAEAFQDVRAPLGIYGVLGNHDFYAGADEITRRVEEIGIKVLRNEHVMLHRNDEAIALLGIDDLGHGDNLEAAVNGVPVGVVRILMSHKPYNFPEVAQKRVDFTVAGHTHGGQIVFARLGKIPIAFASLFSYYVAGFYRNNGTQLYVSRGIGTVGLPMRVNCPPEITLFTLTRDDSLTGQSNNGKDF